MNIRLEDKKVIQYLALVGAVSGVLVALLSVLTERSNALDALRQEQQYIEEHEPLLSLEEAELATNQRQMPPEVLEATKLEFLERKAHLRDLQRGFWVRMSAATLVGACIGAGVVGAILGYGVFWSLCWILTLLAFMLIRGLYALGRRIVPLRIDGPHAQNAPGGHVRNEHRIVPGLIRWGLLLTAAALLIVLLLVQDLLPLPVWLHIG